LGKRELFLWMSWLMQWLIENELFIYLFLFIIDSWWKGHVLKIKLGTVACRLHVS
jgi:hypothetical protein